MSAQAWPRTSWRQGVAWLTAAGCIACLILGYFHPVWLGPANFVYRDAGHFYYPLYYVVADQWASGYWPLWNPWENGGSPLLANPASAVLYPLRIVVFHHLGLSYPAAYKAYILLHAVLCGWGAWLLGRRLRLSHVAAVVAGIGYALAAPVAFQYCNVIFLVGAAWMPFGLLGAVRIMHGHWFSGAAILGASLCMQLLGGDPQAAYVTVLLTLLALAVRRPRWAIAGLALGAAWAVCSRDESEMATWILGLAALTGIRSSKSVQPSRHVSVRPRVLALLALVTVAAAGITSVQWLPTAELAARSRRAAEQGGHSPYGFELPPWRLAEFIWPACYGRQFPENTRWIEVFYARFSNWLLRHTRHLDRQTLEQIEQLLPVEYDPETDAAKYQEYIWVPTIYGGGLLFLLALSAFSLRGSDPNTRWLSWSALLLVLASLGRWGGVYVLMVHALPFFDTFRYPSKLLTPAALMISLLAATAFDHLLQGSYTRRVRRIAVASAVLTLVALVAWYWLREPLIHVWSQSIVARATSHYGPLRSGSAWTMTSFALGHALAVSASLAVLAWWAAGRRARIPLAVLLVTIASGDLYAANGWLLVIAPQEEIDRPPRALSIIQADAARRGLSQSFRIYRAAEFSPRAWWTTSSPTRDIEIFRWEKDTLQPKYGEIWRLPYVVTETTLDLYDYWWFFAPFFSNVQPGRVVYYPRRGFDMWGTRYFILPTRFVPYDEDTGFASLAEGCEVVYRSTAPEEDFQILFNPNAYPRAWIVHRIHFWPEIVGLRRADRMELMRRLLYPGPNRWWSEPELDAAPFDPLQEAFVEVRAPAELPQLTPASGPEQCHVIEDEPGKLSLRVKTTGTGMLVVADVFYPGWRAYVDGHRARIYRVNRVMRGVVLGPGEHVVEFRYEPRSFRLGWMCTQLSLAAVLASCVLVGTVRAVGAIRSRMASPRVPDST